MPTSPKLRRWKMTSDTGGTQTRNCVSCGRAISWDANVCPYCGHDFRATVDYAPKEQISDGMKILLYILSFLIPIAGFIIGAIYYVKPDTQLKQVGKMCIILGLISILLTAVCYCIAFAAIV